MTMEWNASERHETHGLASEINSHRVQRRLLSSQNMLTVVDAKGLFDGICRTKARVEGLPYVGAVAIRHLYRVLRFEETHPFQWSVEHKLIQAHLLDQFCPGSVACTWGLSAYAGTPPKYPVDYICVKRAIGWSNQPPLRGEPALEVIRQLTDSACEGHAFSRMTSEKWIVQEFLEIAREYRVHTLEDRVVPSLTTTRKGNTPVRGEEEAPHRFVETVANSIAPAVLAGTMCGWDVALLKDGSFKVVEINFAGLHVTGQKGFQCSGFLSHPVWGPVLVARLIVAIEQRFGIAITVEADTGNWDDIARFYWWTAKWLNVLKSVRGDGSRRGRELQHSDRVVLEAMEPAYRKAIMLLEAVTSDCSRASAMLGGGISQDGV